MDKDYELKNDPGYHFNQLRGRIDAAIKNQHDEGDELNQRNAKTLPMIPVTGGNGKGNPFKHYNNKSDTKV
jgi:hypothetical protein